MYPRHSREGLGAGFRYQWLAGLVSRVHEAGFMLGGGGGGVLVGDTLLAYKSLAISVLDVATHTLQLWL